MALSFQRIGAILREAGPWHGSYGVLSKMKPTPVERRKSPRHKTLNVGEIVYPDGHCVECTVLGMSEGGATIRPGDYSECPEFFVLRVGSGRSHRCRIAWKNKLELGVEFLSAEMPNVLLVDDDDNALAIYEMELSKHFDVKTAKSAKQGLAIMDTRGPFSVVISDMRMPDLDGARFLGAVSQRAPDTVRIMMTGYSDIDTALKAINLGHVYSFLTKPCSLQELADSVTEGVDQYRQQLMRHTP